MPIGTKLRQSKTTADKALQEKVQNLPLLCVETICKFTPTSKLVRLYSNAVPLPGAFWNFSLEGALKKRLPLSLGHDLLYHQAAAPVEIFDAAGANAAIVKQPEAFRFAPLRQLTERATLTVFGLPQRSTVTTEKVKLVVVHGKTILSRLRDVTELTLLVQHIGSQERRGILEDKDLLERNVRHLLPKLRSLTIRITRAVDRNERMQLHKALTDFICDVALPRMSVLRRLDLPGIVFDSIVETLSANSFLRQLSRPALSELSWLSVALSDSMRFVSSRCRQLSSLTVLAQGEFKTYLAAFRALPGLALLGLYLMYQPNLNGINFNGSEAIGSILNLRLIVHGINGPLSSVFAIASLFPNVTGLAFQRDNDCRDALELASEFCRREVLPAVRELRCFRVGELVAYTNNYVAQFLAVPKLPEAVDLSQVTFESLARRADALTDIYCAMQFNSIKSLSLRGPVHREALSRLKDRMRSKGENVNVIAWKDNDLAGQTNLMRGDAIVVPATEFSQETEVRIVGVKSSGSRKGEPFTIRVFHQLTKPKHIFD